MIEVAGKISCGHCAKIDSPLKQPRSHLAVPVLDAEERAEVRPGGESVRGQERWDRLFTVQTVYRVTGYAVIEREELVN